MGFVTSSKVAKLVQLMALATVLEENNMTYIHYRTACFWLAAIIIGIVALTLWPALVQAGPTLPPRDPPTATPSPGKDKGHDSNRPVGAYIELQTQLTAAGAWSVVQWQDNAGGWRDVEGWRGPLNDSANRVWWVAAKDFGKGSFRWAVTQGPSGSLLGVSTPFNLPTQPGQIVRVGVSP